GIYEKKGQHDTALKYYEKYCELSEALARETKTVQAYEDLALSYFKLATVKEPYNTDLLKQAYDIYCRLCDACPGVQRYENNRDAMKRLFSE
ncbi:MAG: hypothetical protein IKT65_00925, partial [Clostridia bacterium]|nr:hypothetical protein [Clostridia bacterium]